MLARYAKNIEDIDISSDYDITQFSDYGNVSTWAVEQMKYIVENGVITGDMALGYPRLLPRNNATRAEASAMIMRFCKNILGSN